MAKTPLRIMVASLAACFGIPAGSRAVPSSSLMGKSLYENAYDIVEVPNSLERGIATDLNDIRHEMSGFVNPWAKFDPAGLTFTAAGKVRRTC